MGTNTDVRLEQAVATLNGLMELACELGFAESALFLAMAKLHLQIDLNGVTDHEFRALCDLVDGKGRKPVTARARPGHGRSRREADMALTRRAWQCQNGAAVPRGGRSRAK
jgi:hypothetical protein